MVINTADSQAAKEDARKIRQTVLRTKIPYFTTVSAAEATIEALNVMKTQDLKQPKALQDYLN